MQLFPPNIYTRPSFEEDKLLKNVDIPYDTTVTSNCKLIWFCVNDPQTERKYIIQLELVNISMESTFRSTA